MPPKRLTRKRDSSEITPDSQQQQTPSSPSSPSSPLPSDNILPKKIVIDDFSSDEALPTSSPKRVKFEGEHKHRFEIDICIRDYEPGSELPQKTFTIYSNSRVSAFMKALNLHYDDNKHDSLSNCDNCGKVIKYGGDANFYGDFCEYCGQKCSDCGDWAPNDSADRKKKKLRAKLGEEEWNVYEKEGDDFRCGDCFNPCEYFEGCRTFCEAGDDLCYVCKREDREIRMQEGEEVSSSDDE